MYLGIGYRKPDGYGETSIGLSHVISWELANGPKPKELLVLHSCDNPPCVNPEHLFLGTTQDNFKDMVDKGRGWWQ